MFILAPGACQRRASGHTLVHKENLKVNSNKNIVPGRRWNKKGCCAQFVQPGCLWISLPSLVRLGLFLKDIKLTELGGGHDVGTVKSRGRSGCFFSWSLISLRTQPIQKQQLLAQVDTIQTEVSKPSSKPHHSVRATQAQNGRIQSSNTKSFLLPRKDLFDMFISVSWWCSWGDFGDSMEIHG